MNTRMSENVNYIVNMKLKRESDVPNVFELSNKIWKLGNMIPIVDGRNVSFNVVYPREGGDNIDSIIFDVRANFDCEDVNCVVG